MGTNMNVSDLMQRNIVTCSDRDSLERVARMMWEYDIGCLPVVNESRVVGMITDRDVAMAAFLQGAPLRSITTSSVMSKEVVTCLERDDLREVEHKMRHRQIRRIPVVDDRGAVVGMITLSDIARAVQTGKLPTADVAATLSALTHPRLTHISTT
jgi:CBS domain-containing protein